MSNKLHKSLETFSKKAWQRIQKNMLDSHRFPVQETDFNNDLCSEINGFIQANKTSFVPIRLFKAAGSKEKDNGNDFEIVLKFGQNKYIICPTQAKRLFKNGYNSINHPVKGKMQLDILLKYARAIEGLPFYLFYNYSNEFDDNYSNEFDDSYSNEFNDSYGCTILSAFVLGEQQLANGKLPIQKMKNLHPPAEPFANIALLKKIEELQVLGGGSKTYQPKTYNQKEIEAENWVEINKTGKDRSVAVAELKDFQDTLNYEPSNEFKPAFRIIIDIELLNFLPNHKTL
jgi:hypothetical protein